MQIAGVGTKGASGIIFHQQNLKQKTFPQQTNILTQHKAIFKLYNNTMKLATSIVALLGCVQSLLIIELPWEDTWKELIIEALDEVNHKELSHR